MTSFPGSPRLLRHAIVGIDMFNPLVSVIVFRYNARGPTHSPQAQLAGGEGGASSEAMRLKDALLETVNLDVEIDSSDLR